VIDHVILAIDPGAHGALAWCRSSGDLIGVQDVPMIEVRKKSRVSAAGLATLMKVIHVHKVVIEGVGSMPGQGVASSFTFGYGAGLIEGVAAGLGLPVEIIYAAAWKRRAGVPKDKGAARQMASRAWPHKAHLFARVKDDGRAEAALLARYSCGMPLVRMDGPVKVTAQSEAGIFAD
jgi:crossover junction endodeoxyribonuclease RuvC